MAKEIKKTQEGGHQVPSLPQNEGYTYRATDILSDEALLKKFGESFIDSRRCYPEPEYTLKYKGVGCLALGNLTGIIGKPKTGKSFIEVILIASMLGYIEFGFETQLGEDDMIVLMDTDQSPIYSARIKRRIQRLMGWNPEENQNRLLFLNARKMSVEERLELLDSVLRTLKPKVFVIDNIAHIAGSFNNEESSREFIEMMVKKAEENNCLIIAVLHENKGATDSNPKGHLGSMLTESAVDILQAKKDDKAHRHTLRHYLARDRNIEDITYMINEYGLPELTEKVSEEVKRQKVEEEQRNRWENFNKVFDNYPVPINYNTLKNAYCKVTQLGETTAKKHISKTLEEGHIRKTDAGLYEIASF